MKAQSEEAPMPTAPKPDVIVKGQPVKPASLDDPGSDLEKNVPLSKLKPKGR
jgi:hypothetical protein